MAITIAVANQKGGCGKTTTAMNLAGGLAAAGFRVLLVDADRQASATEWRNRSADSLLGFNILSMAHGNLHRELPQLLANSHYEIAVIDCPPGGAWMEDTVTLSAVLTSDVVIIPLRPTPMDYLAAATMGANITKAATLKPALKVFLLINGKPTGRDQLAREAQSTAVEIFQDLPIQVGVFETELCNRTAFARSPAAGMTVLDYEPDSKAAEEVAALTREVIDKCLTANHPREACSRG